MNDEIVTSAARLFAEAIPQLEVSLSDSGFEPFYTAAFPRVYAYIRSQVGSVQIAQDIVGRVFLKAYRHQAKLPEGAGAMVWVFRIAHNVLIDHWRVEGRRAAASVSIEDLAEVPGAQTSPEIAYAEKERHALLLSVMNELGPDDRTVLALKFTAQQTNREIAEMLRLTEAAVSMRLLRALRRLRERLLERGITS